MINFNKEHTETPSHWKPVSVKGWVGGGGRECEEKHKIFAVESYITGFQLLNRMYEKHSHVSDGGGGTMKEEIRLIMH